MAPKKTEDSGTRSQVAPDWTLTQSLILVNEIAAVEADPLSYYQKWKIIAENCAALDVNRTVDQCCRKWDSLFADYKNIIKLWETDDNGGYWGLGTERRRAVGLPEEFDRDLFNAVDDVVKAHPDTDAPPVLRKLLTPQKRHIDEEETAVDRETSPVEIMDTQQQEEEAGWMEVRAAKKAKPLGSSPEEVATQLREKADMIQAILDYTPSDLKQDAASRINFARRQGDKLIDCFSVIASTLDQLCKDASESNVLVKF